VTIWYLGSDYTRLLTLQRKIVAPFVPVAEKINEAARGLLSLILNLDGVLAGPDFDRDAWNASDLGERSRFNSPFFLETARIVAFLNGSGEGLHLAIADDEAFALCIFDAAKNNERDIAWLGGSQTGARLKEAMSLFAKAARRCLGEVRAARRRLKICKHLRQQKPLAATEVCAVDVWVVIWATDKTFSPNVPLEREDRAGRLPAVLRAGGLNVGYIVLPLWPERYEMIAHNALACAEPVLLVEDGATLVDTLCAALVSLRPLSGMKRNLMWKGIRLNAVLRRAIAHECLTGRPIKARQLSSFPRLLRKMGASPKAVVTTYENHSWEKVFTAAVRANLPAAKVIGHNHALVSSFYVSMNPSPGEIAADSIPDCIAALGNYTAEGLAARGFPRNRLAVVGGLRYEDFFERAKRIPSPPDSGTRNVLCCVGVDLDEGTELVRKGAEAIFGVEGLSLIVNFHPMSGPEYREALKRNLRVSNTKGFEAIRFDDRPVRDLLGEAHAVLYVDSNAALEAAAAGRQIIYVVRETGIEFDKMPPGLARHCRTPTEIRNALLSARCTSPDEAQKILAHAIAPVDAAMILKIVQGKTARETVA